MTDWPTNQASKQVGNNQAIKQAGNWLTYQVTDRPINEPTNQQINGPTNRPPNPPAHPPTHLFTNYTMIKEHGKTPYSIDFGLSKLQINFLLYQFKINKKNKINTMKYNAS